MGEQIKHDHDELALCLTRVEVEALLFHYTKNGIPAKQAAARTLAAKLERALGIVSHRSQEGT